MAVAVAVAVPVIVPVPVPVTVPVLAVLAVERHLRQVRCDFGIKLLHL